ncbi:MAG: MOSC domain-containing protein [Hyphomicrobiaceae bacterium]
MSETQEASVTALYRYPVKGLSGDVLDRVSLSVGETFPFDRSYAIENGPSQFDPSAPRHLAKINFLVLMRDERLATLQTKFDESTRVLTILRNGKVVAEGNLDDEKGRRIIEQFMSAYMNFSLRGAPQVVSAPGHSFSDVPVKCVHIVNLASVRDFETASGKKIDPLRFRANIYLDGFDPWAEFKWLDATIEIGSAALSVIDRTSRCDATNVNPSKGIRDMDIPRLLQRMHGHTDFGVYAKVSKSGQVRVGDTVRVTPS